MRRGARRGAEEALSPREEATKRRQCDPKGHMVARRGHRKNYHLIHSSPNSQADFAFRRSPAQPAGTLEENPVDNPEKSHGEGEGGGYVSIFEALHATTMADESPKTGEPWCVKTATLRADLATEAQNQAENPPRLPPKFTKFTHGPCGQPGFPAKVTPHEGVDPAKVTQIPAMVTAENGPEMAADDPPGDPNRSIVLSAAVQQVIDLAATLVPANRSMVLEKAIALIDEARARYAAHTSLAGNLEIGRRQLILMLMASLTRGNIRDHQAERAPRESSIEVLSA